MTGSQYAYTHRVALSKPLRVYIFYMKNMKGVAVVVRSSLCLGRRTALLRRLLRRSPALVSAEGNKFPTPRRACSRMTAGSGNRLPFSVLALI